MPGASPLNDPAPNARLLLVDALRGVAACAVMFYHLYNAVSPRGELAVPRVVHEAFKLGEGGVQIFFVLSGFVIASNLARLERIDVSTVGRFMVRRSVRLDPVYWVMIALNAAFLVLLSATDRASHLTPGGVLANMLYLNGVLGMMFIVPVGWTLAFEVQLYLMLAAALGAGRAIGRRIGDVLGRAVVFAPFLAVSVWLGTQTAPISQTPWAVAAWHMFFLGSAAYWLSARARDGAAWVILGLCGTGAVFIATREAVTLFAPLTALLLVWAARAGRLTFALGGAPLQWLGTVSYSLYLVHPFIGNKLLRFAVQRLPAGLDGAAGQLARWALFVVAAAASLAASWVLWRLVERPAQRWARRVPLS